MGGEAAIPLRFFRNFRELGHECVLLTHARVREELLATFTEGELRDVVFFEDSRVQELIWRLGRRLPTLIEDNFGFGSISLLTQRHQRKALAEMAAQNGLDVVFVPTPISPKAMSFLDAPGVATFFGPLNGGMSYPPGLDHRSSSGLTEKILSAGRLLSEALHAGLGAKRKATGLFVSNPRTLRSLPRATRGVAKFASFDATIDSDVWGAIDRAEPEDAGHFIYVGRLIAWKGVDYAIAAANRLGGRARLTVVGDGPDRSRLEALAEAGTARVDFAGHLTHAELLEIYPSVGAQVMPSVREAGANVCMEALASAVPVIATAWGGAVDVVLDGVDGFLVEPTSEDDLISGIAESMMRFIDDPGLSRRMGDQGRARVLEAYSWRLKARDYVAIFEQSARWESGKPWDPQRVLPAHPSHLTDGRTASAVWKDFELVEPPPGSRT